MHQHSNYRGILEEEEKNKGYEKLFEDIVENFPNMGKETANQVQGGTKSPRQDEPKEKCAKTHSNQTNED